jgi:hypothetical protein
MYDQMRPGKGTLTQGVDHDHHGVSRGTPGKQTRVQQELGAHGYTAAPIGIELPAQQKVAFHVGPLNITVTVGLGVSNARGPVSFNVKDGSFSVGDDHMTIDFRSPASIEGKALEVTGAKVNVYKAGSSSIDVKPDTGGVIGVEYKHAWTVTGKGSHPWTASFSVATLVSFRKKAKAKKKKHNPIHIPIITPLLNEGKKAAEDIEDAAEDVGEAVAGVTEAVAEDIEEVAEEVIEAVPEYAELLLAAGKVAKKRH